MSKPRMCVFRGRKVPKEWGSGRVWIDLREVIGALAFDGHADAAQVLQRLADDYERCESAK